jgi:hypothetical protein
MSVEKKEIWIGLVEVRPLPDSEILKTASGAHVNILTWASNATEFRDKAEELMHYLHLILVSIENPEPLHDRGAPADFDDDVAEIIDQVQKNPNAIMYGTFHTWKDPVA